MHFLEAKVALSFSFDDLVFHLTILSPCSFGSVALKQNPFVPIKTSFPVVFRSGFKSTLIIVQSVGETTAPELSIKS